MASRASDVELHPPARLLDRPLAMTLRTLPRSFDISIAVAVSANIAPRDIELHHAAANRRPERHIDLVLKIAARCRALLGRLTAPAASENVGEDIAESAAPAARRLAPASARPLEQVRKIKAAEIDVAGPPGGRPPGKPPPKSPEAPRLSAAACVRLRRSRIDIVGVKPELVVNLPLLGIAENVVGFGKSLELFFRRFVARIDVRMILARKFAERLADVVDGGRLLHAKNSVIVFIFGLGGHV
jgi:hypothetical protein